MGIRKDIGSNNLGADPDVIAVDPKNVNADKKDMRQNTKGSKQEKIKSQPGVINNSKNIGLNKSGNKTIITAHPDPNTVQANKLDIANPPDLGAKTIGKQPVALVNREDMGANMDYADDSKDSKEKKDSGKKKDSKEEKEEKDLKVEKDSSVEKESTETKDSIKEKDEKDS